jgi:hypothetical protein
MEDKKINHILEGFFNEKQNINEMKNDKLNALIYQISGDGNFEEPKKIVAVRVIDSLEGGNEKVEKVKKIEGERKILDHSDIMKGYLEDLKKNHPK